MLGHLLPPTPCGVRGIQGKHSAQVWFPEDQHPVGEFGADGQHIAGLRSQLLN